MAKRIVGLILALAMAFGVATAGAYVAFASEQGVSQAALSCEAHRPFDLGKLLGE